MDTALWIFNIINTFIIFEYFRRVYGFKYEQRLINIALVVVFYLIHTSVNIQHSVWMNIVSDLILINLTSFLFFKKKIGKLCFNMLFHFYLLTLDLIFTCASSLANNMLFIEMQVSNLFIPYVVVNFVLLLATYKYVVNLLSYDFIFLYSDRFRTEISLIMLTQFVAVIFASLFLDKYISNVVILLIMMVLSLMNAGGILSFLYRQRKKETKEKERLYDHFNLTLQNTVNNEKSQKSALGKIIAKHANKMQKEETQIEHDKHISEMQNEVSGIIFEYDCGNAAVSAIINSIIIQAKIKGIKFKEKIDIANWNFINSKDAMIVMLGLASNAIDTIAGDRQMELKVSEAHNAKMIEVIHTFDETQLEQNDTKYFPSGNEDIKIRTNLASEIAEKYNGDISYEIHKNKFIVTVILPL